MILNFICCALLQHEKNVIHWKAHRIFNALSVLRSSALALEENQEIWTENQYPTEWSSSIVNEKLDEIVRQEKVKKGPNHEHLFKTFKRLKKFTDVFCSKQGKHQPTFYKQKIVQYSDHFHNKKN